MATIALNYYCDLNQAVKVQYIDGNVFSGDNAGNTISVYVMDGDQPATIGGSISADVIRADGSTVAVSGALDGNRAYVILPQACYAVPGSISIVIKNTQNTTITTIAALVGNVYRSSTDEIVDPGTIIPSISSLIAAIDAAIGSIPADYSALLASIAADYSSSKTYHVGAYCWEAGVLKRCIVPITSAETYTAAHWTNAVIGDDLSALKSAFDDVNNLNNPSVFATDFEQGYRHERSNCALVSNENYVITKQPISLKAGQVVSIASGFGLQFVLVDSNPSNNGAYVCTRRSAAYMVAVDVSAYIEVRYEAASTAISTSTAENKVTVTTKYPIVSKFDTAQLFTYGEPLYTGWAIGNFTSAGGFASYKNTVRTNSAIPAKAGSVVSCDSGYFIRVYMYNSNADPATSYFVSRSDFVQSYTILTDCYIRIAIGDSTHYNDASYELSDTTYSTHVNWSKFILGTIRQDVTALQTKTGQIEEYIPHIVPLVSASGLSSGKYIDTATGENWTNGLTNSSGSLYTAAAIDVSNYQGDTLIIEIGSSDAHTGIRESGFCNASNIVSYVVQEKSLDYQSEGGYLRAKLSITDKYFFFSCSSKSHLSISIDSAGVILKETQTDTRYVSTDGSDDNPGTYASPFATINHALENGARCVAIKGGTYKQRIDLSLSKKSTLSIVNATSTEKVTLLSPDCVITETETAVDGYTNVYSAETSKTFGDNNVWIFQEGVADESTLISAGKRMPEQRGQAYRCYDTKIVKTTATVLADALTEIENSESYKWFKDGTTIYFSRPSAVSSSNPICGSFNTTLFSNNARKFSLYVSGIDVKYMSFNVRYTSNSRIVDCSCMNVYGDGAFTFNGTDGLELIRCEAARAYSGTNGDGFNAHSSTDGYAFAHQTTAVLIDCWSHDNNDDGISCHERSEFTVIGGLFEQNYYGGGVTPANGSHCTCIGVTARDNGEGGFLYMNPTYNTEGGVGGQIKCIDCVSESNNIWASATSAGYKINSAGNKGVLIGCKAIGEDYGYYVSDNDGALTLIDCGALNCTTVKGGKTGNITVQNTTIVS